ncbi:prolipoprotein diacylglyceryl transferase [Candidatus Gracilibacteria bacterium]|nr:prolipoprotein diacylglyceryl transferase [Candidatus Gracilibacteria bacterium]
MKIFEISLFGITFGPSYYGLMYALAFIYGFWAIKKTQKYSEVERESLFFYLFIGVILGGRIGYILFYNLSSYISDPLSVLRVWEGGMSFHGGLIGFAIATLMFTKKYKRNFLEVIDDLALIVPIGLFFGRIGNYINKELLGFPYEGFLAVETPEGSFFPSPLVEAFLEGLVIFVILKSVSQKQKFRGQLASLFLILYGVFRTFVEIFIRTPDIQIGYYFGFLTQGSILSLIMTIIGFILYKYFYATSLSE